MAYTEIDLAAIQAARLRGVRTVQHGDRTVTYSSDQEMRQVEEDIRRDISTGSTTRRAKQTFGVARNGF